MAGSVIFTIYGVTASCRIDSLKKKKGFVLALRFIQIKGCSITPEQSCEQDNTTLFKLFYIRIEKTDGVSDLFINYKAGAVVILHTAVIDPKRRVAYTQPPASTNRL